MTEYRRLFDRVPFFESCTIQRSSGHSTTCKSLDLGAGGFSFECDQPFAKGEQVTAIFGENIKEKGAVTYCDRQEKEKFRVGVSFVKARDRDKGKT